MIRCASRKALLSECLAQVLTGKKNEGYQAPGVSFSLTQSKNFLGKYQVSLAGNFYGRDGECTAKALLLIFEKHHANLTSIHNLVNTVNYDTAKFVHQLSDQIFEAQPLSSFYFPDGDLHIQLSGNRSINLFSKRKVSHHMEATISGSSVLGKTLADAFYKTLPFLSHLVGANDLGQLSSGPSNTSHFVANRENKHLMIGSSD